VWSEVLGDEGCKLDSFSNWTPRAWLSGSKVSMSFKKRVQVKEPVQCLMCSSICNN
jgi:hypothetical protein